MLFAKSAKKLYIVLGAIFLVTVVVVLFKSFGNGKSETGTGFPTFDTARVSMIKMLPKGGDGEIIFTKEEGKWFLTAKSLNNKTVEASTERLEGMIGLLSGMKIVNLVARKAEDLKKYGLDTGATVVKLFIDEENVFEIAIGRAEMISQQEMGSYVKAAGSDDIYLVSGFLDMIFNSDLSLYRNKSLTFGGAESWQEIKYSGNEDFTMKRNVLDWETGGIKLDSAKIKEYLTTFATLEGNDFVNDFTPGEEQKSFAKVDVKTVSGRHFAIEAYKVKNDTLISTTLNPGAFFRSGEESLYKKVFPGLKNLK